MLHKAVHSVFPGSHYQTVGFFAKIAIKSCSDSQNMICKKEKADFYAVGGNAENRALLCYIAGIHTYLHQ